MGQPIAVKVVEVCKVAPNGSSTPTSLPLTFFDLRWLRFPPIQCLSFYGFSSPTTNSTSYFFDFVLPKLRHSLSLTLQHCFPIAGHLTWPLHSPIPILKYEPGDAVSLTIAVSDSENAFEHLTGSRLREALECHPLLPELTITHEQAYVMALQITVFANSGFSIGLTAHHAAMDGIAATIFCKLWACICYNLNKSSSPLKVPEKLIPFFERTMIKDPTGMGERQGNELLKDGGPNNRCLMVWNWDHYLDVSSAIRGMFELTRSDLEKLKRYVQNKLKKKVHISTFLIASAYVWTCLVKAEKTKAEEEVSFFFAVDCRPRLDPPVPSSYFGNCTAGHMAFAKRSRIQANEGLVGAVEAISEALSKLENDDGDHDLLKGAENWVSRMHSIRTGHRVHSISGSPIFRVYYNDFGWGRPMKMGMTSIDRTGAFSLWDSRNGGVEIGVVLNKREMDAFAALFFQGLEWKTVDLTLASKL